VKIKPVIGIRREDKNIWEKRVPVVPADVNKLVHDFGLKIIVQPSREHRAFRDEEYIEVGAIVQEDLSECDVIMGVKEIPSDKILDNKCYIYFSHVIKGQSYNMPMLKTILKKKCMLIDYEKIEDDNGRRLIFFGRYAGLAGMVESLHSLGKRLDYENISNPFSSIKQPKDYESLSAIKAAVSEVGEKIRKHGLPDALTPFVCGFTGYGNVSQGAQEIYDLLPVTEVAPELIRNGLDNLPEHGNNLIKVVFHEENMFEPVDSGREFDLQDYFTNPGKYRGKFGDFVDKLTVLVNCVYWTDDCPKLVTRDRLREIFSHDDTAKLKVIGDISCDIEGSIDATLKATDLDNPMFVYNPETGKATSGFEGNGPVIMSIENLPCEIPVEASKDFSKALAGFLPGIAKADLSAEWENLELESPIKRAVITCCGELVPAYRYIKNFLNI